MPAQIIQTNPAPFAKVALNSITLDIIENALRNARTEMDAVLFRTAMSPGIREQHDAFPMIANNEGKMAVVKAGAEWEVLTVNDMGEDVYATPAIVDNALYVRTLLDELTPDQLSGPGERLPVPRSLSSIVTAQVPT